MKLNTANKALKFRLFFRANMALGLLVSAVAVYFIINGAYPDLATRKAVESALNIAMIGGILYSVAFWYTCIFSRPHLEKIFSRRP